MLHNLMSVQFLAGHFGAATSFLVLKPDDFINALFEGFLGISFEQTRVRNALPVEQRSLRATALITALNLS